MTHLSVGNLTIIGSDNGLSPGRRQAIIGTNAGILVIATLGTNFSEILIEIRPFSFKKMHLKMSSGKWRPFCLGLNVLISRYLTQHNIEMQTVLIFLFCAALCLKRIVQILQCGFCYYKLQMPITAPQMFKCLSKFLQRLYLWSLLVTYIS